MPATLTATPYPLKRAPQPRRRFLVESAGAEKGRSSRRAH
jgi:hypothetical protein